MIVKSAEKGLLTQNSSRFRKGIVACAVLATFTVHPQSAYAEPVSSAWILSHAYLAGTDKFGLHNALYVAAGYALQGNINFPAEDFRALGKLVSAVKSSNDVAILMTTTLAKQYKLATALSAAAPWQPVGVTDTLSVAVHQAVVSASFGVPTYSATDAIRLASSSPNGRAALDAVGEGLSNLRSFDKISDFKALLSQGNLLQPGTTIALSDVIDHVNSNMNVSQLIDTISQSTLKEVTTRLSSAVDSLSNNPLAKGISAAQELTNVVDSGVDGFEQYRGAAAALQSLAALSNDPRLISIAADVNRDVSTGQQIYNAVTLLTEAGSGIGGFAAVMQIAGGMGALGGANGSQEQASDTAILSAIQKLYDFEKRQFAVVNGKLDQIIGSLDQMQASLNALQAGQNLLLEQMDSVQTQLSELSTLVVKLADNNLTHTWDMATKTCIADVAFLPKDRVQASDIFNCAHTVFATLADESGSPPFMETPGDAAKLVAQYLGLNDKDSVFPPPGDPSTLSRAFNGVLAAFNAGVSSASNPVILSRAVEGFAAARERYKTWYPGDTNALAALSADAVRRRQELDSSLTAQKALRDVVTSKLLNAGTVAKASDEVEDELRTVVMGGLKLPSFHGVKQYPNTSQYKWNVHWTDPVPTIFVRYADAVFKVVVDINSLTKAILDKRYNAPPPVQGQQPWLDTVLRPCSNSGAVAPVNGSILVNEAHFNGLDSHYKTVGGLAAPQVEGGPPFRLGLLQFCALDHSTYYVWNATPATGGFHQTEWDISANFNIQLVGEINGNSPAGIFKTGYTKNAQTLNGPANIGSIFDFAQDGDITINWLFDHAILDAMNSQAALGGLYRTYYYGMIEPTIAYTDQHIIESLSSGAVFTDDPQAMAFLKQDLESVTNEKALLIAALSFAYPQLLRDDDRIRLLLFGRPGAALLDQQGVIRLAHCDQAAILNQSPSKSGCQKFDSTSGSYTDFVAMPGLDLGIFHKAEGDLAILSRILADDITSAPAVQNSGASNVASGIDWEIGRVRWVLDGTEN